MGWGERVQQHRAAWWPLGGVVCSEPANLTRGRRGQPPTREGSDPVVPAAAQHHRPAPASSAASARGALRPCGVCAWRRAAQLPPARPQKQPRTEGPARRQQPSPAHGLTVALPHGPGARRCPWAAKARLWLQRAGTKSSLKGGRVKPTPGWAWGPCRQSVPLLILPFAWISIPHEGTKGTLLLGMQ